MQQGTVLGLDLGPNSIGWALLSAEFENGEQVRETGLIAAGVRVFDAAVPTDGTKPASQDRRSKRGARRLHKGRSNRKKRMRAALVSYGFLPSEESKLREVLDIRLAGEREKGRVVPCPYELRARGTDRKVERHELARALYHMCQRRGFRSNRRGADTDAPDAAGKKGTKQSPTEKWAGAVAKMLEGKAAPADKIEKLEREAHHDVLKANIGKDRSFLTLGVFLHKLRQRDEAAMKVEKLLRGKAVSSAVEARLRGRHTLRAMYLNEFNTILDCQEKWYPELTAGTDCRKALHDAIFDQRFYDITKNGRLENTEQRARERAERAQAKHVDPDKRNGQPRGVYRANLWRSPQIGKCPLRPSDNRCPKAHWLAQHFRVLKLLADVRIKSSFGGSRSLTREERERLLELFGTREKVEIDSGKPKSKNDIRAWLCQFQRQKKDSSQAPGIGSNESFNLRGNRNGELDGNLVESKLSKVLGEAWLDLPRPDRERMARGYSEWWLQEVTQDEEVAHNTRIREIFCPLVIDSEQSERLTQRLALPDGYVRYSLKALEELVACMRDENLDEHAARQRVLEKHAGDADWNQGLVSEPPQFFLRVDDYGRGDRQHRGMPSLIALNDKHKADVFKEALTSPLVLRTLTELHKVINEILRTYRKELGVDAEGRTVPPTRIVVELAREMRLPKDARDRIADAIKLQEARKAQARKEIAERKSCQPEEVKDDLVTKWMLWRDQGGTCPYTKDAYDPYTGKQISPEQVIDDIGSTEIDHIYPVSARGGNKYGNKVLCLKGANAEKGDRTPYQWLKDTPAHDAMVQRVERMGKKDAEGQEGGKKAKTAKGQKAVEWFMPKEKIDRFKFKGEMQPYSPDKAAEEEFEDFTEGQLRATQHSAKLAVRYLELLYPKEERGGAGGQKRVASSIGRLTSEMRWHWRLTGSWKPVDDSNPSGPRRWVPFLNEFVEEDLKPGRKNRGDHRHHAIDAIVIACATRARVKAHSDWTARYGEERHTSRRLFPFPWPGFYEDVRREIDALDGQDGRRTVSHKPEHKIAGALHQEMFFHEVRTIGDKRYFAKRTALTSLSDKDVRTILDFKEPEGNQGDDYPRPIMGRRVLEAVQQNLRELIQSGQVVLPEKKKRGSAKKAKAEKFSLSVFEDDDQLPRIQQGKRIMVIRRVRLLYPMSDPESVNFRDFHGNKLTRHAMAAECHHIEFVGPIGDERPASWKPLVITMKEAAARKRPRTRYEESGTHRESMHLVSTPDEIRRRNGEGFELKLWLAKRDIVKIFDPREQTEVLCVVRGVSKGTEGQDFYLVLVDARNAYAPNGKYYITKLKKSARTLFDMESIGLRKLIVDALGRLRDAPIR
jgi:CRISPR-associated endonuclease Csn1